VKKLLIAAAAALILAPSLASAADMSGTWKVNAAFGEAMTFSLTCTLKDDGAGKLSGPCTDPQGGANAAATGTVTATTMEWGYDTTYQGSPIHLDYKGDVQADGSLKGTIDAGGPQGTFTATK
jgi:hypothetical protein